MKEIPDKERFCCYGNDYWQMRRPETFFWQMLEGAFRERGIRGLRHEVCVFIKSKCEDAGVYLEFVNCLTHLAESVLDGRRNALRSRRYDEKDIESKAQEWPLYRSVLRCWEVAHQMWDLRMRQKDKRGWHIKLSKLEKEWLVVSG